MRPRLLVFPTAALPIYHHPFSGGRVLADAASKASEDNEIFTPAGLVSIQSIAALLASLPSAAWTLVTSYGRELPVNKCKPPAFPDPR